jgi:hypothetical protein
MHKRSRHHWEHFSLSHSHRLIVLGTPNSCYSLEMLTLSCIANPIPQGVPGALQSIVAKPQLSRKVAHLANADEHRVFVSELSRSPNRHPWLRRGRHVRAKPSGQWFAARDPSPASIAALLRHIPSASSPPNPAPRCSRSLMRARSPSRSCMALPRTFWRSRYVLCRRASCQPSLHVACIGPQPNDTR